jgi:2-isopropylmalate synthase
MTTDSKRYVELYDTTLRDGAQGEGVAFSLTDKVKIAVKLDELGFDYIEGGYPLSNPKDAAFFDEARKLDLKHAKICAFGMTRRKGVAPADDVGMQALANARAHLVTIVGKTWDLHVDEVLRVDRQENLDMIRDSLAFCRDHAATTHEVFYDAEHFFDGYRANRDYALQTLAAAVEGGATRLVLCDTNGGSLPAWIAQVVEEVRAWLEGRQDTGPTRAGSLETPKLAIHVHNDGGLAVANSLIAVAHGAVQVQGTINGIGERCGNVDLITVGANLRLKMGLNCLRNPAALTHLTELSRYVYELANLNRVSNQPYVGSGAFSHKGGMHVHAVRRVAHSYEHVPPETVGNARRILVSELSGASNIAATLGCKFNIEDDKELQKKVLQRVVDLENQGYQFESAGASFELLLHEVMGTRPVLWTLDHYRCVILKREGDSPVTEATVKLTVPGPEGSDQIEHRVAEGDGPVNALDAALRKCLRSHYPQINEVHLTDFRVRVVNPTAESAAKVRVIADFQAKNTGGAFSTIGVNENIVEASWQALTDAFAYHLMESAR